MGQGALLYCPGVATLVLPWWPTEVGRTPRSRVWVEQERPGRAPLLLTTGETLAEYRLSFLLRHTDIAQSVQSWVDAFEAIAASDVPVALVMGASDRGLFQLVGPDMQEVAHADDGTPSAVDVSATLKRASRATVNVGLVPTVRNENPNTPPAKKAKARKRKGKR